MFRRSNLLLYYMGEICSSEIPISTFSQHYCIQVHKFSRKNAFKMSYDVIYYLMFPISNVSNKLYYDEYLSYEYISSC